jgi:hypothetical protein
VSSRAIRQVRDGLNLFTRAEFGLFLIVFVVYCATLVG